MIQRRFSARQVGYFYSLAQIGLEMVAPIGLGLLVDWYWQTTPWATIVGAVLGFVGGLWHLIKLTSSNKPANGGDTDRQDTT